MLSSDNAEEEEGNVALFGNNNSTSKGQGANI
jgi:hypothetical protein